MTDPWLTGPLTSTAYGWRLERRDGICLGFTSHDRDVEIDGLLYRASPGMAPSAIVEAVGLEPAGLDVRGALSSDSIRVDDLQAGRWDGAELRIFLFDWTDPAAGQRPLASGTFGSIAFSGDTFEVGFDGAAARLNVAVAPYASPTCRARFGDGDCGVSAERYRHEALAISAPGSTLRLTGFAPAQVARLPAGELRWLEGPDCGKHHQILSVEGDSIMIFPHFQEFGGARRVELVEGCDKTIATCASRFANGVNFRGEPYLPGNDLLTRYPGAA